MKALDYIGYLKNIRKTLIEIYYDNGHLCEPIMTNVWYEHGGDKRLTTVFVHEKDKNRNTLKSLRYTHREL